MFRIFPLGLYPHTYAHSELAMTPKLCVHSPPLMKVVLQEITMQPTIEIADLQKIKDATASLDQRQQKPERESKMRTVSLGTI